MRILTSTHFYFFSRENDIEILKYLCGDIVNYFSDGLLGALLMLTVVVVLVVLVVLVAAVVLIQLQSVKLNTNPYVQSYGGFSHSHAHNCSFHLYFKRDRVNISIYIINKKNLKSHRVITIVAFIYCLQKFSFAWASAFIFIECLIWVTYFSFPGALALAFYVFG